MFYRNILSLNLTFIIYLWNKNIIWFYEMKYFIFLEEFQTM